MTRWAATSRLRVLITGRVEWYDPEDDAVEIERMGWRDRWAIFGTHSYSWWWVRKFGSLRCGCTRNPLTRSVVLIAMDCPEHGIDWTRLGGGDDGR